MRGLVRGRRWAVLLACAFSLASPVSTDQANALSSYTASSRTAWGTADQEQCLTQNLASVQKACSGPSGAPSGTGNMRDSVIKLLQSCLLSNTTTQGATSMRFLLPLLFNATLISSLTSVYETTTGIKVNFNVKAPTEYASARLLSIANPRNRSITDDVWMITPSALGDGIASGAFMDLSQLVLFDQKLQWQGLISQMRSVGLVYGSKVIALPLSSDSHQLFYRMDTFRANSWTVPVTWHGLVELAQRINGTNNMYGFCGIWGPCGLLGTNLIKYILSSYQQTFGAPQGWLIDPDSMNLMLDTPAVAEALTIIKKLYMNSPTDETARSDCDILAYPFARGQCHMTIDIGTLFKGVSHSRSAQAVGALHGNLGVAAVPGSTHVLDRKTNTLVPCDENICPYATRKSVVNPTTGITEARLVNYSPGFEALLFPLNAQSPDTIKFYAYAVTSYIARPDVHVQLVFNPASGVFPTRAEQLNPVLWQRAGYNLADASRYCSAHAAAMSHPNLHVQLRVPGASNMIFLFGSIMSALFAPNSSVEAIVPTFLPRAQAILNTSFRGNMTALRLEYWSSINRRPQAPPPPSRNGTRPVTDKPEQHQAGAQSSWGTRQIILVACLVGGFCALFLLTVIVLRSRIMKHVLNSETWRKHPGVGPDTTLVVTDIEGSTMLWEALDAQVMDTSVKLHNACIRRLAANNKGYESVWEGDSFIIAFPSVLNALQFASAAQVALLHVDWPSALLSVSECAPVWAVETKAKDIGMVKRVMSYGKHLLHGNPHRVSHSGASDGGHATSPTGHDRPSMGDVFRSSRPTTERPSFAEAFRLSRPTIERQSYGDMSRLSRPTSERPSFIEVLSSHGPSERASPASTASVTQPNMGRPPPRMSLDMLSPNASGRVHPLQASCSKDEGSLGKAPCKRKRVMFSADVGAESAPHDVPVSSNLRSLLSNASRFLLAAANSGDMSDDESNRTSLVLDVDSPRTSRSSKSQTFKKSLSQLDAITEAWNVGRMVEDRWRTEQTQQSATDVLAFRGLRVRMGFHAGLQDESDIVFNKASARYVYTGTIRKAANAVASAGKGGHIIMSSQTAARLGMDQSGTLQLLPDDVGVYYMGTHMLQDMPHTSVPLLLALPKALSCRLAVMDHMLRTVECVSLGCLAAPCSGPAETSDIVLVGMHISGLQSLMTWNQTATQEAVRQCMEMVHGEARRLDGVISEDGASLAVAETMHDTQLGGLGKEAPVPGRVIAAFADPSDALQFAVSVRHCLQVHQWGDELMGHPLCDRIESKRDVGDALAQHVRQRLAGPGAARMQRPAIDQPLSRLGTKELTDSAIAPSTLRLNLHPTMEDTYVSDAPLLVGLRIRFAVASGTVEYKVATNSTGRVVYSGKAAKKLRKLLHVAGPGQLLVTGAVTQAQP